MSKFSDFDLAEDELRSLVIENFFGIAIKQSLDKFSENNLAEYFYYILKDWASDDQQYLKDIVKELILLFMQLFTEAMYVKGQEVVDNLTYFIKGYPTNPESENLSSYTEYLRSHEESKILMKEFGFRQDLNIQTKIKLAHSLVDTYIKGFEFVNKILTSLIILLKISKNEKYDPLEINSLFFGRKAKIFKELSDSKYDRIIDLLDRDIRNSYSHLNLRYSPHKMKYILKVKSGKRFKTKEISVEDFLLKIYPTVGLISQAFIYSISLLILTAMDKSLYIKVVKQIYGYTLKNT